MSKSKRRVMKRKRASISIVADHKKAFGEALDRVLSANQMTQTDLANAVGVSKSYVSRMMNGTRPVTPDHVDTISTSLGISGVAYNQLHQAAAISAGFKLDLTKPEKVDDGEDDVS